MQALFAWEFGRMNKDITVTDEFPDDLAEEDEADESEITEETNPSFRVSIDSIVENMELIDSHLRVAAPAWPTDKINKIDLAILRQAIFELLIDKKAPQKVVVDEAVELAKTYGSENSASFINGAMGKLISDLQVN